MAIQTSTTSKLNLGIRIFFSEFVRVSLRHPGQALFFVRTVLWQGGAARRRAREARGGLHVPPIAIFSITNGCNLRWAGRRTRSVIDPSSPSWHLGSARWNTSHSVPPLKP